MGTLRDITTHYNGYHLKSCPCGKSVDDFMEKYEYKPFHKNQAEEILLVANIPNTHPDYLLIVRKHFLILAQRYHPDKNESDCADVCNRTMSILNQSYCAIEANYHATQSKDKSSIVKDGKIYTYPAKEIITCQHHESFAVYCHPEYLSGWKDLIEQEWKSATKTTDRTSQYGNNKQSVYITTFSNGTVFIQGNQAISYSLQNIWRLISSLQTPTSLRSSKRSAAFKEALKLFENKKFQAPDMFALENNVGQATPTINNAPTMLTQKVNGGQNIPTENHSLNKTSSILQRAKTVDPQRQVNAENAVISPNQPEPTSATTNHAPNSITELRPEQYQELMSTLALAMTTIANLEEKFKGIQQESNRFRQDMQTRVAALEKENEQLRTTLGPRISLLLQRQHSSVSPPYQETRDTFPSHGVQQQGELPSQDAPQQRESNGSSWATVTRKDKKQPPTKSNRPVSTTAPPATLSRPGRIQFQKDKVVIIENIKEPTNFSSDDKVRREIGKNFNKIIIDRITHYSHNPQKLMIQLANESMKDEMVSKWDTSKMFGSSTIRTVTKSKMNVVGVAKGVPLDMTDEELKDDIHKTFQDVTFSRMTKGPEKKKLRAVKLYFHSTEQLQKAMEEGLKLESQSQYVRVEQLQWIPHVRQCTNCWRLGHSQKECHSQKACPHCSKNINDGSHQICIDQPKCRNCNGEHSADKRSECTAYHNRLVKIITRHKERQNDL